MNLRNYTTRELLQEVSNRMKACDDIAGLINRIHLQLTNFLTDTAVNQMLRPIRDKLQETQGEQNGK